LARLFAGVAHLLPPTIHPMLVHFPIALLYLTAAVDIAGLVVADRDRFLQRAGFWLLTLTAFFTVLTIIAGLIAQHEVTLTPAALTLLHRHQSLAVLTGAAIGLAWLVRLGTRFRVGRGWSVLGRGRSTRASTFLVVVAAVLITLTASLGGRLVYEEGVAVRSVAVAPGTPAAVARTGTGVPAQGSSG
jgi:uncharacterized membrane protein